MIFKKMKHRTNRQILLPLISSLLLALILITFAVSNTFFNIFFENSKNLISQKQKTSKLFFDLIEGSATAFSINDSSFGNIISKLDSIAQANQKILGAAFIDEAGNILTSSRTSGYPSAEQLFATNTISDFAKSDKENIWLIRKAGIPTFYNNHMYEPEYELIAYIKRESNGYLIIDLDPSCIREILEFPENSEAFNPAILYKDSFILWQKADSDVTRTEYKTAISKSPENTEGYVKLKGKNCIVLSAKIFDDMSIAICYSYGYVISDILQIIIPISAITLIFILIAIFNSAVLTKTISKPLEKLYNKIQEEKLSNINHE